MNILKTNLCLCLWGGWTNTIFGTFRTSSTSGNSSPTFFYSSSPIFFGSNSYTSILFTIISPTCLGIVAILTNGAPNYGYLFFFFLTLEGESSLGSFRLFFLGLSIFFLRFRGRIMTLSYFLGFKYACGNGWTASKKVFLKV